MSEHHLRVKHLQRVYSKPTLFQRLFFPKKLAQALIDYTQEDNKTLFAVYQTFCNHVWFFHRWLFPELTKFSTQPTTQACVQLTANNFLSQKSFDAIINHNDPEQSPIRITNALLLVQQNPDSYITNSSIDAIKKSSDPEGLAYAICYLKRYALIGQGAYILQVYHAPSDDDMPRSYQEERQVQEITPCIISALSTHPNPMNLATAIRAMTNGSQGTSSLTALWSQNQYKKRNDWNARNQLNEHPILSDFEFTKALIEGLAKSQDPLKAVESLYTLNFFPAHNAILQTMHFQREIINAIAMHPRPDELVKIFTSLHEKGLLNEYASKLVEYCQTNDEAGLKIFLSTLLNSTEPKSTDSEIINLNTKKNLRVSSVNLPIHLKIVEEHTNPKGIERLLDVFL